MKRPGLDRPPFAFANALLGRPHLHTAKRVRAARRRESRACLTPTFALSDGSAVGRYDASHSMISGAALRRTLALVSCLCAAVLALYSCSLHASVTTDSEGHIVELSSLRVESSLARVAVAMLVAGGQVGLELRWIRCLDAHRAAASAAETRNGARLA